MIQSKGVAFCVWHSIQYIYIHSSTSQNEIVRVLLTDPRNALQYMCCLYPLNYDLHADGRSLFLEKRSNRVRVGRSNKITPQIYQLSICGHWAWCPIYIYMSTVWLWYYGKFNPLIPHLLYLTKEIQMTVSETETFGDLDPHIQVKAPPSRAVNVGARVYIYSTS